MAETASLFPREYATEPPDGDKGREERGAFYTADALALAICRSLREMLLLEFVSPKSIFEPGCGAGAFLRAVDAVWPSAYLLGVDIVPACSGPGLVVERDLFEVKGAFDLIVGNPDFAQAEAIVRHCLAQLAPGGYLALLLLADFEGSQARIGFWREHPIYLRQAIGDVRPCFRADGQSDQRPYAIFVWKQGWRGPEYRGLPPLVWKAR